jgi:hypothetical protein
MYSYLCISYDARSNNGLSIVFLLILDAFYCVSSLNHLKSREKTLDTYNLSGVCQLKWNECPLRYIGQTGRSFGVRYKEHTQAIRTDRQNSHYAHVTTDQTLEVLHIEKKGHSLNTLYVIWVDRHCK